MNNILRQCASKLNFECITHKSSNKSNILDLHQFVMNLLQVAYREAQRLLASIDFY